MDPHLLRLLVRYGAPMLFLAQMFGIFGLPIPDELLLTIAGALIRRGTFDVSATVAAAVAGSITGITLSYVLGRTVCVAALRRIPGVHAGAIDRARQWFTRWGKWLLAFGYFIPGIRHVTAIAAGSAPLEYRAFAAYAYPGAVVWSVTFLGVGYYAGDRAEQVALMLRRHSIIVAAALGAVALVYVIARRRVRA